MRRVGRWGLNGLMILSLVLCAGTGVALVRSYFACESVEFQPSANEDAPDYVLGWARRGLFAGVDDQYLEGRRWVFVSGPAGDGPAGITVFEVAGVRVAKSPPDWRIVIVPYWLIMTLTVILPGVWTARRFIERRRRLAGGCPVCQYDLTGNVSGVCPECGREISNVSPCGGGAGGRDWKGRQ